MNKSNRIKNSLNALVAATLTAARVTTDYSDVCAESSRQQADFEFAARNALKQIRAQKNSSETAKTQTQKKEKEVMKMSDPRRNSEGYPDPTAYEGLKTLIREEEELENRVNTLIKTLKNVIRLSGFEIIDRIEIKDVRTGREFK